jgi:hypothetical protein
MEAKDKSGKVKFTFEMEVNQPVIELIGNTLTWRQI